MDRRFSLQANKNTDDSLCRQIKIKRTTLHRGIVDAHRRSNRRCIGFDEI
jgi:hypothetical protein